MTGAVEKSDDSRLVASRIAARSQILDIRGVSVHADLLRQREVGRRLSFDLEREVEIQFDERDPDQDSLVVEVEFSLKIRMASEDDVSEGEAEPTSTADPGDDEDLLAILKFGMQGLFALEMRDHDEPPERHELEAFGKTTGLFALYPFAREWAHDLTGRLGLPPLTLPIMLIQHDGPQDAVENALG